MGDLWSRLRGETIRLGERRASPPPLPNQPKTRLIGDGPPESSTNHGIERQPFVWDCNGFYRRLGLKPGASRREVAQAYLALDGEKSSRLTLAAATLIDKVAKRHYDAMPLGSFWPFDPDLVHAIIDGDLAPDKSVWSVYVYEMEGDDIVPAVRARIDTWRWMIGLLMWRSGIEGRFAMGLALNGFAGDVGFRKVLFVPLDAEPSWQYAADLVVAMQSLD